MIQKIQCPQCQLCINECILQNDAIRPVNGGVEINLEKCIRCGHCEAICPHDLMENPLSPKQEPVGELLPPAQAIRFLRTPRSVRYYRQELIPQDVLSELINIGRYPQTGENSQGIEYLVVSGKEKLAELNRLYCRLAKEIPTSFPDYEKIQNTVRMQEVYGHDALFYDASQMLFAISDESLETWEKNAQFSLTFISLLAPSMGIGTCWVGLLEFLACRQPYMKEFARLIDLPAGKRICACMLVGYPAVQFRRLVERDPLKIYWR